MLQGEWASARHTKKKEADTKAYMLYDFIYIKCSEKHIW